MGKRRGAAPTAVAGRTVVVVVAALAPPSEAAAAPLSRHHCHDLPPPRPPSRTPFWCRMRGGAQPLWGASSSSSSWTDEDPSSAPSWWAAAPPSAARRLHQRRAATEAAVAELMWDVTDRSEQYRAEIRERFARMRRELWGGGGGGDDDDDGPAGASDAEYDGPGDDAAPEEEEGFTTALDDREETEQGSDGPMSLFMADGDATETPALAHADSRLPPIHEPEASEETQSLDLTNTEEAASWDADRRQPRIGFVKVTGTDMVHPPNDRHGIYSIHVESEDEPNYMGDHLPSLQEQPQDYQNDENFVVNEDEWIVETDQKVDQETIVEEPEQDAPHDSLLDQQTVSQPTNDGVSTKRRRRKRRRGSSERYPHNASDPSALPQKRVGRRSRNEALILGVSGGSMANKGPLTDMLPKFCLFTICGLLFAIFIQLLSWLI